MASTAPPGEDRLIIGHESLGRWPRPPGNGFAVGDLVVGIVRRRDTVPCPACAKGHWDTCTNGQYTERSIKGRHGYASERYRIHPEYLVAVDPALGVLGVLLEPATVVAKAVGPHREDRPASRLGATEGADHRGRADPAAGRPSRIPDLRARPVIEGRKPEMVRRLGATYVDSQDVTAAAAAADVVIECAGFFELLLEARQRHPRYRICLTGVSAVGAEAIIDPGMLNRTWSCRTRSCSARSTPTGSTTNWPPRR